MGKFKIPTVSSTTNKTVRFPNNKIDRVDKAIQGEKGINIIAPTPYKKKIEETKPNPDTQLPMLDDNGNEVKAEKEIQIRSIDFVGIIPPSGCPCRSRVY